MTFRPPGESCGHVCCDDPTDPLHDHFLTRRDCAQCTRVLRERLTEQTEQENR